MIDKNKKYRTRDGREVRIYATDGRGDWPVHGAYLVNDGWHLTTWRADGSFYIVEEQPQDLIEVRPRIKIDCWVNVYDNGHVSLLYKTEQEAHSCSGGLVKRIACVKLTIDCEEGEGL